MTNKAVVHSKCLAVSAGPLHLPPQRSQHSQRSGVFAAIGTDTRSEHASEQLSRRGVLRGSRMSPKNNPVASESLAEVAPDGTSLKRSLILTTVIPVAFLKVWKLKASLQGSV